MIHEVRRARPGGRREDGGLHRRGEITGGVDPGNRRLRAVVRANEALIVEREAQTANQIGLTLRRAHDHRLARHERAVLHLHPDQVIPVSIPPLRERRDDVIALARHFIRKMTPEGHDTPVLTADGEMKLVSHAWPGNVRELRNVIERAMAFEPLPRLIGAAEIRF